MRKLSGVQVSSQTLEKFCTDDSEGSEMKDSQQVTVWFKIDDVHDIKQNILRGKFWFSTSDGKWMAVIIYKFLKRT